MKKALLSFAVFFFGFQKLSACADDDQDYDYFNLFAQDIIQNKEYEPFLLTYSSAFYGIDYNGKSVIDLPDENIETWQKYFDNKLTYDETNALVTVIKAKHLVNYSKGILSHKLFEKLGKSFYTDYQQGFQYLIKAKELEPYMRVKFIDSGNYFYHDDKIKTLDANQLDYSKTIASLLNAYKTTSNKEIKLRYGYQIVRFNHYTRNYTKAIQYFDQLVEPIQQNIPIYWYALDQKAGAQRGLGQFDNANWNFFQVFIHSKNKKTSAYNSMFLAKYKDFKSILAKAKTPEEKNMAYFLLAYNNYGNPIPIMEKMYANNADSEILKVLTVRAINQLEREYLPVNYTCYNNNCPKMAVRRLPLYMKTSYSDNEVDFSKNLQTLIEKYAEQSSDVFWKISESYVAFLNKDYAKSSKILGTIKTNNIVYQNEISHLSMLNDIISQPKITTDFEEILMKKYASVFEKENSKQDAWTNENNTKQFLIDILANRYFIEHQDAKSYLLNNKFSDLQYNPNSDLVKQVEAFYRKPNKTSFEKYIAKSFDSVGNADAFFNVIYGDQAMRDADFSLANSYYQKAKNFSGIPRFDWQYNDNGKNARTVPKFYKNTEYDGFNNISSLVFGFNIWESFQSTPEQTMQPENLSDFPFIKKNMNKLELSDALIQLQNSAKGKNEKATKANELIGNLLYNTTVLGYYREIFVMDVDNSNGPKFQFGNPDFAYQFYYKTSSWGNSFIKPDRFDRSINYYKNALSTSKDDEQKARILFQMASAEQGKYYQWEVSNASEIRYDDPKYDEKTKALETLKNNTKNEKYRTAFAELKKNYNQTKTAKALQTSCSYFAYYMKK